MTEEIKPIVPNTEALLAMVRDANPDLAEELVMMLHGKRRTEVLGTLQMVVAHTILDECPKLEQGLEAAVTFMQLLMSSIQDWYSLEVQAKINGEEENTSERRTLN